MKVSFCPELRHWETERDKVVTVSEFFESCDWDGEILTIIGCQANDYNGASHLFEVSMRRDLAMKFFGECRLFSASIYPHEGIRVTNKEHLMNWARENGITSLDELGARFHEYKKRFLSNYICGPDGYIRISVY